MLTKLQEGQEDEKKLYENTQEVDETKINVKTTITDNSSTKS